MICVRHVRWNGFLDITIEISSIILGEEGHVNGCISRVRHKSSVMLLSKVTLDVKCHLMVALHVGKQDVRMKKNLSHGVYVSKLNHQAHHVDQELIKGRAFK